MKNIAIFLSIIGIIGFMMINIGNKTTVAKGELDLLTLASVMQGENILIKEWSLHAREKMEGFQSLQEVKAFTDELQQKYPDWEWSFQTTKSSWEATAVVEDSKTQSETVKILSTPTKGQVQTYVIYEAKGQGWEKEEQSLATTLNSKISDIFRGNATIFSCIQGEFNGKINKSLPDTVNQLLAAFKAKEIEALKEDQFISTSAYSPLLGESIETNGKEMNMQLGLRTKGMGAKTTIVIGTPIITIEY
ncbi:YwmB family TATA-box binding protein [Bacillus sp. ISL-47]|uniref:YwmB family TATA-box binding protein n=1 Tax=Bacillus sp. ISL-47 TaxID=2819130 RepID=UPI001BECBEFF|nr:YwmB family TATA-box binding protein [Bacillus sp. ISL-47]MBT2690538.1 YwmB family TATA-box binding protein [Bacillus sp. ISL-47]MBT2710939.1 YwmB family TATA-box binding protein [Pseudomonas sp. ISL-84]